MPRAAQSAWREGSNLQQNRSRNYVYRHSKSCPRPKMLYFSWTAWTEIVGKVARVANVEMKNGKMKFILPFFILPDDKKRPLTRNT